MDRAGSVVASGWSAGKEVPVRGSDMTDIVPFSFCSGESRTDRGRIATAPWRSTQGALLRPTGSEGLESAHCGIVFPGCLAHRP
ncbi:hypothetical protein ACFFX0_07675 [Citricoccus parietis]|uniref:Uncharacterized protein n=1 Tax=Citricoccus parietis TaxID=592307 RepID=A0ABV5FWM0_9MICC